jgi:hypothetical protein
MAKRTGFRFHLSTLLVSVFVLSLVIGANCVDHGSKETGGGGFNIHFAVGFPFHFMEGYARDGSDAWFYWPSAIMDAAIGIAIFVWTIGFVGFLGRLYRGEPDEGGEALP